MTAFSPLLTPVYAQPFRTPGVAVPAAAKTVVTDNTNIASLLTTRGGAYQYNSFTFENVFVEPVGNVAINAGKLYLLETYDGTTFKEVAQIAHGSQGATATSSSSQIVFTQFTALKPLIIPNGCEIVIATAVAQTAGGLIAHLSNGRMFGIVGGA